ncbi:hypothetical protein BDN70DRAFT_821595, partial [Pholiota conissans]
LLLKEEMRRVLAFLEWKAKWWRSRGIGKDGLAQDLAEGILAYARDQAAPRNSESYGNPRSKRVYYLKPGMILMGEAQIPTVADLTLTTTTTTMTTMTTTTKMQGIQQRGTT